MNSKLIKWAAIGAGAWILWRYLKPAAVSRTPNPGEFTGNPNAPVSETLNKESGYKTNIPLGY
jgi:hypothetical protein